MPPPMLRVSDGTFH